jgi:hypothetical protein
VDPKAEDEAAASAADSNSDSCGSSNGSSASLSEVELGPQVEASLEQREMMHSDSAQDLFGDIWIMGCPPDPKAAAIWLPARRSALEPQALPTL